MSEETVKIEINGVALEVPKGSMLIEAADRAGIAIPRFCYHKNLSVAANCRMCLVEVEKAPKPLPACATPVMDGMKAFTDSALAVEAQRSVMEFLLINHPLDCPICDQGGECELQDLAMGYGSGVSRFNERKRVVPDKDLGPLIATDMTRCIHCTRCIRFGVEVAGMPELGATGRGEDMRIGTFVEQSVDSELSGNMIDVCPVGALTSKPFRYRARAWEMHERPAVAPHDLVGSNLGVHLKNGRVMRVVPRENEATNETWISDRDRFAYAGLYSDDRLLEPRIRRDGEWVEVDWEVALEHAAGLLRGASGSDLAALGSPSSTTEELYLLQKMMRGLGCADLDHRLRQVDFRDQESLPAFPHLGQSLPELENVDAALLIGSYCRKEQPLVNHRLRKAALRGAIVMSVDSDGHTPNFDYGTRRVAHPAALAHELAGIAKALSAGSPGMDRLLAGVEIAPDHQEMARCLDEAKRPTVLIGPSALAHPDAAALRALASAIAERAGATLGYLSEGANSAGAALAGMLPHRGPGGAPATNPGRPAAAVLSERSTRGYVLLNLEPELDCAFGAGAREAMDAAAFVVAMTAYATPELEACADVMLPIAGFAETPGTYVNGAGLWQSFDASANPPGQARPAWRILRVLGNLLDVGGFDYQRPEDVCQELRAGLAEGGLPANVGACRAPETLPDAAGGAIWRCGGVPPYAVDPLVRRSGPLQRTADAAPASVSLHPDTARELGLEEGGRVTARQGDGAVDLPWRADGGLPPRCARIPAGLAETACLRVAFGPIELSPAGSP